MNNKDSNLLDLYDNKYDEVFEKTYLFLKPKNLEKIDDEIRLLEATLDSLLINAGNDWIGRGELSQIRMNAQIAATETLIIELREFKKTSDNPHQM